LEWLSTPANQPHFEELLARITPEDAVEIFWDDSTDARLIARKDLQLQFPDSIRLLETATAGKVPLVFHGVDEKDGVYYTLIQRRN
jgi:hypothetical protein